MNCTYRRGDICQFYDMAPIAGTHVLHGERPVLIVSADNQNCHGTTAIIVPLTTKVEKRIYPGQFDIIFNGKRSRVLCNQIRVVDKKQLGTPYDNAGSEIMDRVDLALVETLGIFRKGSACLAD